MKREELKKRFRELELDIFIDTLAILTIILILQNDLFYKILGFFLMIIMFIYMYDSLKINKELKGYG